ncbi:hypothetical protein [Vibrio sinaloensis]|uniref:hypothetical protein n=1 Tax=Photobacterium sp. (strain ATCC 43367) TaxID=379097 RepID=UPI0022AF3F7B|nr:hypothetical protein [Vibrio sinaloensis]MCZ4292578.1 hypothetical protein [Vibrio sinaloensis]
MDDVFKAQLSDKTDSEIKKYRGEVISEYISSEKVDWKNKKFVLEQQKIIDEMLNSVPTSDSALSLILSELTTKLSLLHKSLSELKKLQQQAMELRGQDENG